MPTLSIVNPATGKKVDTVPCDDPASVRTKYSAARAAQPSWAETPLRERLDAIRSFRAAIRREKESLARDLTTETGKPITQARNELEGLLPRLDFFLEETATAVRRETVFKDRTIALTEVISHEPVGVIANISAWNYPYFVGSNVFIPALLAGNAVLYKPSEFATLTGLNIARLLHASGVPADVFAPIVGSAEAGSALLRQRIDGVFFTGSVPTGKKISRAVAGRLIKVQLELGGKDPVYVCNDVDLAATAAAVADGAFYNNGQSCCSVERIYVDVSIFDDFLAAFVAVVNGFKVGDPQDPKTYIGPLTRAPQIALLEDQIADAVQKGARIVVGGKRLKRQGNYFQPTVLVDVDHRMDVMRKESFGPTIGLMPVRGDAHAIELMNDTEYGLTASVYTPDEHRARALLEKVDSGSAYWNCCDRVSPRLPWSGTKNSGIGLTLSRYGIQAFTRQRAWHLRGKI